MGYRETEHRGRSASRWSPAEGCECSECMSHDCDGCGEFSHCDTDPANDVGAEYHYTNADGYRCTTDLCAACLPNAIEEMFTLYHDAAMTVRAELTVQSTGKVAA